VTDSESSLGVVRQAIRRVEHQVLAGKHVSSQRFGNTKIKWHVRVKAGGGRRAAAL
jgi:hypothetical protein